MKWETQRAVGGCSQSTGKYRALKKNSNRNEVLH